ncbi:hypothetical protein A2482_02695 [Candidatus Falkowbacteria bacterium RIFOXYC2_FULL_48_21]|uniref:Uncharacterized protein n=1 Tax=Candidatus Falkowbacteria bacterium RIFOXYC2_FULL_48_21 TaxID=1798005 RepID=A0A1F5TAZ3_9BACT|nr:MAG: hypothetical protein A2482_02695 [Candidatus Falkowbacteria bacterium RIFOXYC2_FULL_48_21]
MRKLILEFYQPEEGSEDMGFSRAWGFKVFQDGKKFFREDSQAGGSELVTRMDGSTFSRNHEPWKGEGKEISREAVEEMIKRAKNDSQYTVACAPSAPRRQRKNR